MTTETPAQPYLPAPVLVRLAELRTLLDRLTPAHRLRAYRLLTDGFCPDCGAIRGERELCLCSIKPPGA